MIKKLVLLVCCLIALTACSDSSEKDTSVFQYKDAYIGDNSAVINIAQRVTTLNEVDRFKLQTEEEPYGIELYYKENSDALTPQAINKEVHQQSVYLYYLIKNVDYVSFNFNNQVIHTNRNMYDQDLKALNKIENINEQKVNNYLYDTYAP
ncbi:hypothetical protein GCM10012290_12830 [Halolactibacillus alkaliphilus]|uniref:DUF4825 domain-containing protein n=1 Tax=Halolactibacillus alkaliphilus TaxID=442899 RepID=A0A511X137_9BACI|nr:DUF4825 domain-containing protein [Halolactibacillus alkaliphilus]GEN56610.1 hypothetical protein HAL01_10740 [Halolactibacillus alkaliphilus]GGN69773.1 hypothetical protein GCM10012290_12830 [Halolactibacillus alkaliphilus]SFO76158.1 protein of unknown function [Halolactibacillus alkaliphilus]